MSDELGRFEEELKASRLTNKTADGAAMFYRCGYEAALATMGADAQPKKPFDWTSFCGGAAAGVAAVLLTVACWTSFGRTHDVVQDTTSPSQGDAEQTSRDDGADSNPSMVVQADELPQLERVELPAWELWSWPQRQLGQNDTIAPQSMPLSAAANRQWVSLIEGTPAGKADEFERETNDVPPLGPPKGLLNATSLPDVL